MILLLLGCFERLVVDIRVDARRQLVHVVSVEQSSDRPGSEECTTVEACLAILRAARAEAAGDLVAAGALAVRTGLSVRGNELDFIDTYDAPLASELFAGDSVVQRVTLTDQRGRVKTMAGIFAVDDPKQSRTVVTGSGTYQRLAGSMDPPMAVWFFPRGRGTAHVEVTVLDGEGNDTQIEPWIDKVAGLADALRASDLFLDPTTL